MQRFSKTRHSDTVYLGITSNFNPKITAKQLVKTYCERFGPQLLPFSTQIMYTNRLISNFVVVLFSTPLVPFPMQIMYDICVEKGTS